MRKLMWFAVGFCAACILGAYFHSYTSLGLAAAAFSAAILLAFLSRLIRNSRIPAMILFAFSLGLCWLWLYDSIYLGNARDLDGKTIEAKLEVSDYSYETEYGSAVTGRITVEEKAYQVLIYLDGKVSCKPGDSISGIFRFRFTSEGGSREPTYHRSEGIYLLAYQAGEIELTECMQIPKRYYPALWRNEILNRIERLFPDDAAALVKALLLGDRSDIDYETSTAFKISGISHIVAVSGLHVTILFSVVYLLSGRRNVLTFLIGTPALLAFAAVAGFTPSIIRACIMQFLMLLAMLTDKEYDPPTALGFAALVMLCVNPMVIISISFQLSVGCMIGIFCFSKPVHDWMLDKKRMGSAKGKGLIPRLKRWFVSSVSISLSASVITTPLVAWYFGTVSLVSILTNLIVVWLVSYVFYGAALALLISLASIFAGKVMAYLVVLPIRFIIGIAKTLSRFPLAAVYTQSRYIVAWLVAAYALLAVFLVMKKKPVLIYSCCVGISLCAALVASWAEPLLDECRVTVLDVGQGQCILLQSEGRTYLVDCGGDSDTESADIAAETLLSQGIYRLDGIIVTHYDEDHAGGIPYLLSRIPADTVFVPDTVDEDGIGAEIRKIAGENGLRVSDDLAFTFGSTKLTIYGPELYDFGNESSLCVLFQTENCDILITGDRGSLGEMLLLHRADLPELEVLIAGHHGSAYSTGEDLLAATKPEYVLISVGKDNSYGHPADALLERLRKFGCEVYRTDENGTIIYRR